MAEHIETPGPGDRQVVPGAWPVVRRHPKVTPLGPRLMGRARAQAAATGGPTTPWIAPPEPAELPWPAPASRPWTAQGDGELRRRPGWAGRHRLLVRNRTRLDAVVTIANPASVRRPCVATWVGAGRATTITGIAAGTYNVIFDLGEVWDGTGFSRTGRRLQFVEVVRFARPRTGAAGGAWEAVLRESARRDAD